PILETLKTHLQDKELLLVVDNFEQLVPAGGVVEELVSAAPKLKVLITSRVVLSLRREQKYGVPPLEPPDPKSIADLDTLNRSEAVRLFTERALAIQPRFRLTSENAQAVAEITARLDGLPLAIELAATRVKVLTPQQMLPRLERSLSLLVSGGRTLPERQRTLRGAIAWSYDLLDKPEQSLFRRLSVFSGGWTLEAGEAVAEPERLEMEPLEGLSALVDKSLVRPLDPADGLPRFVMLETIRQFGQEALLTEGELDPTRRRHGEYFLNLVRQAEGQLTGAGGIAWWQIDRDRAGAFYGEALAIERELGEPARIAEALYNQAFVAGASGDVDRSAALLEESLDLFRAAEVEHGVARALAMLVMRDAQAGDWQSAIARLEEVVAIWRRLGDRLQLAFDLIWLAFAYGRAGRPR